MAGGDRYDFKNTRVQNLFRTEKKSILLTFYRLKFNLMEAGPGDFGVKNCNKKKK